MRVLDAPTTVTLIEAIEVTTMIEKLHARATGNARQPGGGTRWRRSSSSVVKLIGEIECERAAGTDRPIRASGNYLEATGPFYSDIEEMAHYQVTAMR
ncbi:MAG: hypothetical protein ACRDO9_03955 [Gaiellales bacterium]